MSSKNNNQPRADLIDLSGFTALSKTPRTPRKSKSASKELLDVPKEKHETGPSMREFRAAFAKLEAANTEKGGANAASAGTLKNIEKRIVALEKNRTFKAENFGAHSFDVESELNLNIPANSLTSAAHLIKNIIAGHVVHPKRFGARGESMVIKTTASKIVAIPPTGTGGFVTGDNIVIVQPVHTAYKGVIVFAVNPTTGVSTVIGYAAPDRDPELISTACATLFSDMRISAPAAITGTNVAVTAQLMLEMAKFNIFPVSLIAGKVAPLAEGRRCPILTIGPEQHRMVNFTATDSENLVKRLSPNDPLNQSLVIVPGTGDALTSSSAPQVIAPFTFLCTGETSEQLLSAGFSAAAAAATQSNMLVTTAGVNLWNLKNCSDFNRHLLYGDVEGSITLYAAPNINDHKTDIDVTIEYQVGDGTVTTVTQSFDTPFTDASITLNFSTRGNSQFAAARGAVISNIYVNLDVPLNTTNISFISRKVPQISITFLDVSARTAYIGAVISGAQSGYRVAVSSEVHTEIFLDPAALNSTFLSASDDLPYDPHYLPYLVRTHMQTAEHDMPFSAGSFMKTMDKITRIGGKVGSVALAGMQGLAALKGAAAPLMAMSFGAPRTKFHPFTFPAFSSDNDTVYTAVIPITSSNIRDKEISAAFPSSQLGYGVQVDGRSATLALLLANLAKLGYNVRAGTYSGEVTNVVVTLHDVTFDLHPVAGEAEKIIGSQKLGVDITGCFADGFTTKGSFQTFDPRVFTLDSCASERIESLPNYPGTAYRVRICKD